MSIRLKLIISFLALAILPGMIITPLFYAYYRDVVTEQFTSVEVQFVTSKVDRLYDNLEDHIEKTKLAALYPPIQGIIRTTKSETGIDPEDGSTLEEWKERLQSIFISVGKVNDDVFQMRFIDENGQELVRVNSRNGLQSITDGAQLQNKADRDYFINTMKLSAGQAYVSSIELNQEFGQIEKPIVPTLRFATPVFDENDGGRKGVVIMNVFAQEFLDSASISNEFTDFILTNREGDFLLHPEDDKAFSHELGGNENYFGEQPELAENTKDADSKAYHDEEDGEFRIWQKVYYNPSNSDGYWVLFSVIKNERLFSSIVAIRNYLALIWASLAAFVVIAVAFLAHSISTPLRRITEVITEISKGNLNVDIDPKLLHSKDETGLLAQAFNRTIVGLKMAMNSSSQKAEDIAPNDPSGSGPDKDIQVFR